MNNLSPIIIYLIFFCIFSNNIFYKLISFCALLNHKISYNKSTFSEQRKIFGGLTNPCWQWPQLWILLFMSSLRSLNLLPTTSTLTTNTSGTWRMMMMWAGQIRVVDIEGSHGLAPCCTANLWRISARYPKQQATRTSTILTLDMCHSVLIILDYSRKLTKFKVVL